MFYNEYQSRSLWAYTSSQFDLSKHERVSTVHVDTVAVLCLQSIDVSIMQTKCIRHTDMTAKLRHTGLEQRRNCGTLECAILKCAILDMRHSEMRHTEMRHTGAAP